MTNYNPMVGMWYLLRAVVALDIVEHGVDVMPFFDSSDIIWRAYEWVPHD